MSVDTRDLSCFSREDQASDVLARLHAEFQEERFDILADAARNMVTGILGGMRSQVKRWPPLETFGEADGIEAIKYLVIGTVLQGERFNFTVDQAGRVRADLMDLAGRSLEEWRQEYDNGQLHREGCLHLGGT